MCNLLFVLFLLWGRASATEEIQKPSEISSPKRPTVELYGCKGSKFGADYLIQNVPSYPFFQMIDIRIREEPFPGCKSSKLSSSQNFTSFADKAGNSSVLMNFPMEEWANIRGDDLRPIQRDIMQKIIEKEGVSISPVGFLNVKDHNYDLDEFCVQNFAQVEFNRTLYNHTLLEISYCPYDCSDPKSLCIPKCCALGQSLYSRNGKLGCYTAGDEIWKGFLYDKSGRRVDHEKQKQKGRKYHYHRKRINCNAKPKEYNVTVTADAEYWFMKNFKIGDTLMPKTVFRLSEDVKLQFLGANRAYEQLKDDVQFCIDGFFQEQSLGYNGAEDFQAAVVCSVDYEQCYETNDKMKKQVKSAVYMASLFTASGFYLATTVVYLLLWDNQKIQGWTIVSLMVSLFFMCSSTATAHMLGFFESSRLRNSTCCKANAIIAHYFYITSFTWLCIVNYDIWSTFRALHRRSEKNLSKLWWYSLVGWGIPLAFICVSITLNELYPERESMVVIPEYGDSKCFIASWAQGPYIYYPLIFPIIIILALTVSTFWNIFGFQKETGLARSSSSKSDRKLAKLYLKLSLILGTSWSFEVISWMASSENCQHWIWMVADLYNALSAILIFTFFGCKNSNLVLLEEKFPLFRKLGLCRSCRKTYGHGESSGSSGTKSTGLSSTERRSSSAVRDESIRTAMTSYDTAGIHNHGYENTRNSNK